MWVFLLACAAREPVRHEVEAADLAALGPERLEGLDAEERALAESQGAYALAQERQGAAAGERDAARSQLEGARANRDAARAELRAAEVTRDPARTREAQREIDAQDRAIREGEALVAWKDAALDAAEAEAQAARAAVDLRHAELEMARVDLVADQGRGETYTKSQFLEQLTDTRRRWERAEERAEEAAVDAEEARRAWEDVHAAVQTGS